MKRVLITGASSGIGMHLAKLYLSEGHQVIACGRSKEKLSEALPSDNKNLQLCIFELTDQKQTIEALQKIQQLDLVILNAGVCEYIDNPQSFNSSLFERVVQTNVIGTGYCLEGTLKNIRPGGQLAIVSSSATLLPFPRAEAYGSSKAALDYLAQTLSIHLAANNISVSLIRPGFVDTPLTQKNTFPMPNILTTQKACEYIVSGLHKRKKEINFPRGFYLTLKLLSILPDVIWRRLALKMVSSS